MLTIMLLRIMLLIMTKFVDSKDKFHADDDAPDKDVDADSEDNFHGVSADNDENVYSEDNCHADAVANDGNADSEDNFHADDSIEFVSQQQWSAAGAFPFFNTLLSVVPYIESSFTYIQLLVHFFFNTLPSDDTLPFAPYVLCSMSF